MNLIIGVNHMKNLFPDLTKDTSLTVLMPYISIGEFSLHQVIELVLEHFGIPADLTISSYSITENAVRSFQRLKEKGLIERLRCVFDLNVKRHRLSLLFYGLNIADEIYLTRNHSKIVIIEFKDCVPFAIIGSANLNNNDKIEDGLLTNHAAVSVFFKSELNKIISESLKIELDEFN